MPEIIGTPNFKKQGTPNNFGVRLAYMTKWGEKIKKWRVARGMKQIEFARLVGVKPPSVAGWESGKTKTLKGHTLMMVCQVMGTTPEELMDSTRSLVIHDPSIEYKIPGLRSIPIISTVQAGEFFPTSDPYPVGFGDGEIPIGFLPLPVGPRAFGLRIRGDSMLDEFQSGDIVVIDPDAPPRPMEPVVAKRDEDDEATFKLYRPRGSDEHGQPIIELVPINEHYPKLVINAEHPGRIIGPMVARIQGRRSYTTA